MNELGSVAVGGLIALVSGAVSSGLTLYFTSRREWVFRVRDERRTAYETFLTELDKALTVIEEVGAHTGDSSALAKFQHAAPEDPFRAEVERTLLADVDRLRRAEAQLSDAIDRLGLVAGTPVYAKALRPVSTLLSLQRQIREFVNGRSLTSVDLVKLVPSTYRRDVRRETVDAMQRDLSQPWLRHVHDRSSQRWWRVWERPPALDPA